MNVAARDKATGKQQQVTIQSSGGLSDEQINRMVREAEQYASADATRKEGIEARNEADTLLYSAERSLEEHKDKVGAEVVQGVEGAMGELRTSMDAGEAGPIRERIQALQKAMMRIGEQLNKQAGSAGPAATDAQEAPKKGEP